MLADRLVKLHLHHKVATPAEIKPKLYTVIEIILQLLHRRRETQAARAYAEDSDKACHHYGSDEAELIFELVTYSRHLALLLFRLKPADCTTSEFHFHLLGDAQLHGVVLQRHNGAVKAAVRDYLIPDFQTLQHFIHALALRVRGANHEEVEDGNQCNGEQYDAPGARLLSRLGDKYSVNRGCECDCQFAFRLCRRDRRRPRLSTASNRVAASPFPYALTTRAPFFLNEGVPEGQSGKFRAFQNG